MRDATQVTTTATHDADYATATAMLRARLAESRARFPEGEFEHAIGDALNNEWAEGLTLREWVDAAARRISASEY